MIKKLTVKKEEKMKRLEEKSAIADSLIPPYIMDCLWRCAPGCQSGIEGDGELSTAFGLIAEPIQ
jgi:hypothetical protein